LVKGSKYIITDYQTVHNIIDSTDVNTAPIEPLIVTAISSNEIDFRALSLLFPKDEIYYSIENNQIFQLGCTKGHIYRRIDTIQNNDFPFDFRNVRFRRWQIDIPN
jgi:hypothetical protein